MTNSHLTPARLDLKAKAEHLDFVQEAVALCVEEFAKGAEVVVDRVAKAARGYANARQSLMDQRDGLQDEVTQLRAELSRIREAVTRKRLGKLLTDNCAKEVEGCFGPPDVDGCDDARPCWCKNWGLRQADAIRAAILPGEQGHD